MQQMYIDQTLNASVLGGLGTKALLLGMKNYSDNNSFLYVFETGSSISVREMVF